MVRKSAAGKKLIPRALLSAAASNLQSSFLEVSGESDPLYKKKNKNASFLVSTIKRKYPCRDTSVQIMARGM